MPKKRSFLIAAVLVGLEPLTLGWLFRGSVHIALISPALLAVVCCYFLSRLTLGQQLRWIAAGAGVATGVLTVPMVVFGPVRLALVPTPFWFPWLFLFAVAPLLLHRWASRTRSACRPLVAVVF